MKKLSNTLVSRLLVKSEVALNGEEFLLDLGRTLRLALDPLRTRRIRACRFAHRTPALSLAVRATVARQASGFQLAVWTGGTRYAFSFHLAVRAGGTRRTVAFHLAVRAGVARHTVAFPLAMRAGFARHTVVFQLAVRARVARHAVVVPLAMRAPLIMSPHYPPPRARASALREPGRAKTGVVAFRIFHPEPRLFSLCADSDTLLSRDRDAHALNPSTAALV